MTAATRPGTPVPPKTRRYVVARTDEVPEGERLIVEVAGRKIGIFHIDGEFYALRYRCPHLGGPLCAGEILGLVHSRVPGEVQLDMSKKLLTCPWHGWEFDIKTGQSYIEPGRVRARQYPVQVESGEAVAHDLDTDQEGRVAGPFRAEVIPVSLENDYIVVTMRPAAQ